MVGRDWPVALLRDRTAPNAESGDQKAVVSGWWLVASPEREGAGKMPALRNHSLYPLGQNDRRFGKSSGEWLGVSG